MHLLINTLFLFFALLTSAFADTEARENLPRVSIITPLYRGEEFIEGFFQDITAQTIFDDCELIVVTTNPSEKEIGSIQSYSNQYTNIKTINLDTPTTLFDALNLGIKQSQGEYIYYASVDNRLHTQAIEKLATALNKDPTVDCVYSDYWVTKTPNETFANNSYHREITLPEFQPQLLHSCITGPQPLWRKSLHDRFGYFRDDFVAHGKWEFWNRISRHGASCQKIGFVSTLCYENPNGVTATRQPEFASKREKEFHWTYLTYCGHWLQPRPSQYAENDTEKPFVIVIPSYNNKSWYRFNLGSVFAQKYSNYRVIYVDDCSPDGTGALVAEYIKEKEVHNKITLICNQERCKAMANLYHAIHQCRPNEIVVTLDGDDWFAHDYVLAYLNQKYQDPDVWLTYGQFAYVIGCDQLPLPGISSEIPQHLLSTNTFRKDHEGKPSHLRTFYAGLFQQIKKEDLLFEGDFFSTAYDVAMMVPLIEMAGTHCHFTPDILYMYNRLTPINDDKVNLDLQIEMGLEAASRKKYKPIERYLPTISNISK